MSQERRQGGGKPGKTSVTGSPDSYGMHALIGAIDTSRLRRYFSAHPKRTFNYPILYSLNLSTFFHRYIAAAFPNRLLMYIGIIIQVFQILKIPEAFSPTSVLA